MGWGGAGGGCDNFGNIHRTYITCETERLRHVALSQCVHSNSLSRFNEYIEINLLAGF